jgi:hypothetical protein
VGLWNLKCGSGRSRDTCDLWAGCDEHLEGVPFFFLSYQDGSGADSVRDEPWIGRGGYPSSSTVPSNITSLVRTGIVLLPIDLLRMKARPYEIPDSAG